MDSKKYFIDLYDAGDCVVKAMFSDKTKEIFSTESVDFQRGASWGMSWAFINISANCPRYVVKEDQNESKADC